MAVPTYPSRRTYLPAVNHHIIHDEQEVGQCNIRSDERSQWFNGIIVSRRGEGFGPAAYAQAILQAIEVGQEFRNDYWISPNAKNRWESLATIGVARVVKEFKQISPRYYEGLYVVNTSNTIYLP